MKVHVNLTIDLNYPIEEIGKRRLRDYVETAVLRWGGGLNPSDELFDGIANVKTSAITAMVSIEDARILGGKARARSLSPKRRTAIAKAAAKARWDKK